MECPSGWPGAKFLQSIFRFQIRRKLRGKLLRLMLIEEPVSGYSLFERNAGLVHVHLPSAAFVRVLVNFDGEFACRDFHKGPKDYADTTESMVTNSVENYNRDW